MECVDSGQVVLILNNVCGFRAGRADFWGPVRIRQGDSPQLWARNRRFLVLKGRFPADFGPRAIRTICRKSARLAENPQTLFRIRTACSESTRHVRNPHSRLRIRKHCLYMGGASCRTSYPAGGRGTVLFHRAAASEAQGNSPCPTPGRSLLNLPKSLRHKDQELMGPRLISDTYFGRQPQTDRDQPFAKL